MKLLTLGNNKKPKQYINQLETLKDLPGGILDSVKVDLGKKGAVTAVSEVTGREIKPHDKPHEEELHAGEEINLSEIKEHAHQITELGHEFAQEILQAGKKATAEQSQETQIKVQEILIELKQLAKSTKDLKTEVEIIAVEQSHEEVGVYHVSFLENMLHFLRDLRLNVEDSLAWFTSLRSKKAARQYGSLSKKHGTSFTLSGERTVATQTG